MESSCVVRSLRWEVDTGCLTESKSRTEKLSEAKLSIQMRKVPVMTKDDRAPEAVTPAKIFTTKELGDTENHWDYK